MQAFDSQHYDRVIANQCSMRSWHGLGDVIVATATLAVALDHKAMAVIVVLLYFMPTVGRMMVACVLRGARHIASM